MPKRGKGLNNMPQENEVKPGGSEESERGGEGTSAQDSQSETVAAISSLGSREEASKSRVDFVYLLLVAGGVISAVMFFSDYLITVRGVEPLRSYEGQYGPIFNRSPKEFGYEKGAASRLYMWAILMGVFLLGMVWYRLSVLGKPRSEDKK